MFLFVFILGMFWLIIIIIVIMLIAHIHLTYISEINMLMILLLSNNRILVSMWVDYYFEKSSYENYNIINIAYLLMQRL